MTKIDPPMAEPIARALVGVLDDQVRELDAASLSKLNRARQNALEQLSARRWWQLWLGKPALALASVSLLLVLGSWIFYPAMRAPAGELPIEVTDAELEALWNSANLSANDIVDDELTANDDDFALASELDFYAWLAASEPVGGT